MHQVPVILEAELFHRAIHHAQKSAHGDCQYRRSWNQHRWWGQDLPLFTAPWLCFDPIYIMTPCPRKYPYLPIPQSKITLFSKQYLFSCWLSHPIIHTHSHHSHYYFFFFFYIPTTHYSKRWTQHSSFRQILALIKRKSKRRSWIHVPWVFIQHISNPELPLEAGTDHWTHLKQINL